jgi:hypothetical protein
MAGEASRSVAIAMIDNGFTFALWLEGRMTAMSLIQ